MHLLMQKSSPLSKQMDLYEGPLAHAQRRRAVDRGQRLALLQKRDG